MVSCSNAVLNGLRTRASGEGLRVGERPLGVVRKVSVTLRADCSTRLVCGTFREYFWGFEESRATGAEPAGGAPHAQGELRGQAGGFLIRVAQGEPAPAAALALGRRMTPRRSVKSNWDLTVYL